MELRAARSSEPALRRAKTGAIAAALCSAVTLGVGCSSSLPATELPPLRQVTAARGFPQLRDYRGIVDCRIKPVGLDQEAVAAIARDTQIDFVCLGDRATPDQTGYGVGGFTAEILFIPGASFAVGKGGTELVGLNLKFPIGRGKSPAELGSAIRKQGGLAVAAGTASFPAPADYASVDAMAVYGQRATWDSRSPTRLYLSAIFLGPDRFFSALDLRSDYKLARYDRITEGARVTLLAAMGAPANMTVLGTKVGTLRQLFLTCTTHILARERRTAALMEALKRGHSYLSFDLLGYVSSFAFYAAEGKTRAMMGEELKMSQATVLKAELPRKTEAIVLVKDGLPVARREHASSLEFVPKSPGVYRIEAYRAGGHPWILSNPVYLR